MKNVFEIEKKYFLKNCPMSSLSKKLKEIGAEYRGYSQ